MDYEFYGDFSVNKVKGVSGGGKSQKELIKKSRGGGKNNNTKTDAKKNKNQEVYTTKHVRKVENRIQKSKKIIFNILISPIYYIFFYLMDIRRVLDKKTQKFSYIDKKNNRRVSKTMAKYIDSLRIPQDTPKCVYQEIEKAKC